MALPSTSRDQLAEHGYVLIKENMPRQETVESLKQIGKIEKPPNVDEKQTLTPLPSFNSTPNTYSGNYGHAEFPLHTDLAHWQVPPRYLALRCIVGTESVSTRLLDSRKIVLRFGRNELRRILVHPRRAVDGRRPLLRVLDTPTKTGESFRWDTLFNQPTTNFSENMISEIVQLLTVLDEERICLASNGDTLVIDNWRMLHGRSAVAQNATQRKIERVYLSEIY
jgi:hypothetical protein